MSRTHIVHGSWLSFPALLLGAAACAPPPDATPDDTAEPAASERPQHTLGLDLPRPEAHGLVLGPSPERPVPRFPEITVGPYVTAVDHQGATVVTRLNGAFDVRIELSTDKTFAHIDASTSPVSASRSRDHVAQLRVDGLEPGTTYHYRVVIDGEPLTVEPARSLHTAPEPGRPTGFTIGLLADASKYDQTETPAYQLLASHQPAFVVQLGDFDHRGPGASNPTDPDPWRRMFRDQLHDFSQGIELDNHLLADTPFVHIWDDHDYLWDDGHGRSPLKPLAQQAFAEYFPLPPGAPNPEAGFWHVVRWGQVEVFVLDLRSQREVGDDETDESISLLAMDPIVDDQKSWLEQSLLSSDATWKVIVSSSVFNPASKDSDSWATAWEEQDDLLGFIETYGVEGVFVVSGDIHSGGAIDDGTFALLPELSVPTTNLDDEGCTRGRCGPWSEGVWIGNHPQGYATITFEPGDEDREPTARLETWSAHGELRHQLELTPAEAVPWR